MGVHRYRFGADMTLYEQHVCNLRAETEREVRLLHNEVHGNAEDAFDPDVRNLMVMQLVVMRQLQAILSLRIERFA